MKPEPTLKSDAKPDGGCVCLELTVLDYFAGLVAAAIAPKGLTADYVADHAYRVAQAMMRVRAGKTCPEAAPVQVEQKPQTE